MSTIRISQFCIGLALCAAATPALAEWTGKGDVGASFASGNTENEVAQRQPRTQEHGRPVAAHGGLRRQLRQPGRRQDRRSAGKCAARRSTTFTERAYGFGAARYENDEFSQYDFQTSLAGGLGYKIIDTERTKFWVQGGPGYRYAKLSATGESEDGVIFRGDLGFEHQLTDTTKIVERFLVEAGSDNTYLQNDLGLEVTISGALGLRVGYQVRHNTDVEPDRRKHRYAADGRPAVRDQVTGLTRCKTTRGG